MDSRRTLECMKEMKISEKVKTGEDKEFKEDFGEHEPHTEGNSTLDQNKEDCGEYEPHNEGNSSTLNQHKMADKDTREEERNEGYGQTGDKESLEKTNSEDEEMEQRRKEEDEELRWAFVLTKEEKVTAEHVLLSAVLRGSVHGAWKTNEDGTFRPSVETKQEIT